MLGAADRALGAQVLQKLLLQNSTRLYIKASYIVSCDTCLCGSSGNARFSQPAICSGDHLRRSLADTTRLKDGQQASLQIL